MRHQAIYNIYPETVSTNERNVAYDKDNNLIILDESLISTEVNRLQAEYDTQEYARNRVSEYPTIAELTVALYDTDDKAALETKRAAVKTKWPKDNSGPVE